MKKPQVLNDFIIVEEYNDVRSTDNPFANQVDKTNLGRVIESGDEEFKVGELVYYLTSSNRTPMNLITGKKVYVMKSDNIVRKVDLDAETQES